MINRLVLVACAVVIGACGGDSPPPLKSGPIGATPDSFRVAFATTRGTIVVQFNRAWSPKGVDRVYEVTSRGLFDDNGFFRVLPGFVVQFGAFADPKVNAHWDSLSIADEPRLQSNLRGTIAFAQLDSNSRTHQLFINLGDNKNLDKGGFTPVGKVITGMSIADVIYSGYAERPQYNLIATLGTPYLRRMFPKLDYIKSARVMP